MASFNDIIRGTGEVLLTRRVIEKDITAADVHVSSAIGNSEAPQLPFPKMPHPKLDSHGVPEDDPDKKRKKKPKPHAFIGYDQRPRDRVMSEERGPATNAEDGDSGVTVKRLDVSAKPTMSKSNANYVNASMSGRWCQDCSMFDAVLNLCSLVEGPISRGGTCDFWRYRPHADGIDHVMKRYGSTKELPDAVRGKLKGKKRRQWMHVFNSSLGNHGDESRAFAEAWSTVKKKSDTLSGEPIVGVGGRRLEPFDAGTFFVPMKYDPSALSYLRDDQVPRFLDAITHPDELQITTIPIADLVAVKGRVSRETIQKHLDKMAEEKSVLRGQRPDSRIEGVDDLDPPVVVFMNGTFYLVDGHDRTVAMWLDGIDMIDVAFVNLEAYDNTKPDPDATHRKTAYALLQGFDGRTLTNYVDGTLAVPFMVDLQFFSHLRPDQVPKFTWAVTHPDKLSDAKVSLASLVAIQNRVNANTVAEKVETGWKKPPVIVRMNDMNYIADGHDRLTASWLRGDDEVTVKLTDITWADNSMRPSDIVKSTMEDRTRAKEKLEAAEGLVKSISVQVDEVNRQLVEKQAEADRLRAEADRYEVEKRAAVEKFEAEKRAEVEKFEAERVAVTSEKVAEVEHALKVKRLKIDRKLESADDYVEEMARQQKKLDRYVADQQESVDRQVAKVERETAERLLEAERYVEYVAKAKRKAKKKLEQAVEKSDAYSEKTRGDADWYLAEKRLEADRYDVNKRAAADQYDLDKRTDADRYAVAKRQETDESVFERKRELNKMELGQLDEIQNRGTTELSARQIAQIQVLKKQLKTGARQLKVDVKKVDQDKRQIFGWASVVTKNGEVIWDKQGDAIPVEELEEAVYSYMLQSRDGGNLHVVKGVSRCIESMMWTVEKAAAMGVPLPNGIEGWWTGFFCDDDDLWNAVKKGALLEFSIGGQAVSTKLED